MAFVSPDNPAALIQSLHDALKANDFSRSLRLAQTGIGMGLKHPLLYTLRSKGHEQRGMLREALADLKQAIALEPNDASIWNELGVVLGRTGDFAAAGGAFETAIRLRPDFTPAYHNLARQRIETGDDDGVMRAYEGAIAANPNDADAFACLAEQSARRGDWEATRSYAKRTLALAPRQHQAMIAYARAAVGTGSFEKAEMLLNDVLNLPGVPALEVALAQGVLGDLRHAEKRHDEAFRAYETSAAGKHAAYSPAYASGSETVLSYAQWLNEVAMAAGPRAAAEITFNADENGGARGLVFLVGAPRSGTTLLDNVLAGSPDIVSLQEKNLMTEAVRDLLSTQDGPLHLATLAREQKKHYRDSYWKKVRERGNDVAGKVFVDTNPLNALNLLLLPQIFPGAKVLFALRDPRDVVLSCFRSAFVMSAAMFEFVGLENATRFYDALMTLGRTYRDTLGVAWLDTRHEDLVADFDGKTQKICDFIGIDWNEAMRDFHLRAKERGVVTLSAAQVSQSLNAQGVGQWRNYREQLAPVLPRLAPWVARFGYPAD